MLEADSLDPETPGLADKGPLPGVVLPRPGNGPGPRSGQPSLLAMVLPSDGSGLSGASFQIRGSANQPSICATARDRWRSPTGKWQTQDNQGIAPGMQAMGPFASAKSRDLITPHIHMQQAIQTGKPSHHITEEGVTTGGIAVGLPVNEKGGLVVSRVDDEPSSAAM